jgi:hypothetical protein
VVLAILLPHGASARSAGDDFSAHLSYAALVTTPRGQATESLAFTIQPLVSWDGGEPGSVTLRVELPDGVTWATGGPGPPAGCTRTPRQAVCTSKVTYTGTNLAAAFGSWALAAARPGSYAFSAAVAETARPDPNPANDSVSLTVDVKNAGTGGVALKPARPKTSSTLTASIPVWVYAEAGNYPLSQGSVSCAARIASAKAPAKGTLDGGRASCAVRIGKGASGKSLRGTILVTSAGLRVVKAFSARIG